MAKKHKILTDTERPLTFHQNAWEFEYELAPGVVFDFEAVSEKQAWFLWHNVDTEADLVRCVKDAGESLHTLRMKMQEIPSNIHTDSKRELSRAFEYAINSATDTTITHHRKSGKTHFTIIGLDAARLFQSQKSKNDHLTSKQAIAAMKRMHRERTKAVNAIKRAAVKTLMT